MIKRVKDNCEFEIMMKDVVGTDGIKDKARMAAYALNMCTVSVSQIVDYNDLYIMEQEYDAILNNLNLENMPKDQALLDILDQILDVISYFRITDIEKQMMELEYQEKMKNAIWNAVPSVNVIIAPGKDLAAGSWLTAGISLASVVGSAYMNYRKSKAEIERDKKKQEWELQKSAMEQFHTLQRELFNTAWKLSDKHNFPDEYRLTQPQINQYNSILMDYDILRRYERFESVMNNFLAYPPFWYQMGHAALLISKSEGFAEEVKRNYAEKARICFDYFLTFVESNILRYDQTVSSCALERFELLDLDNEKDQAVKLLETAIKSSGNALDIKQICAVYYLRLEEYDVAEKLFLDLVNENYNCTVNGQVLSSIYVREYLLGNDSEKKQIEFLYKNLTDRMETPEYLVSLPIGKEEFDSEKYLADQKVILKKKYENALIDYIKQKEVELCRCVLPEEFIGDFNLEGASIERYIKCCKKAAKSYDKYAKMMGDYDLIGKLDVLLFGIIDEIDEVSFVALDDKNRIIECISEAVSKNREYIEDINKIISEGHFKWANLKVYLDGLQGNNLDKENDIRDLIMCIKEPFSECMDNHLMMITSMDELTHGEGELLRFCQRNNLPIPKPINDNDRTEEEFYHDVSFFGASGVLAKEEKDDQQRMKDMQAMFDYNDSKPLNVDKGLAVYVRDKQGFDKALRKQLKYRYNKKKVIAIFDDTDIISNRNLVFDTIGIFDTKHDVFAPYHEVKIDKLQKCVYINGTEYTHDSLDLDKFENLLSRLRPLERRKDRSLQELRKVTDRIISESKMISGTGAIKEEILLSNLQKMATRILSEYGVLISENTLAECIQNVIQTSFGERNNESNNNIANTALKTFVSLNPAAFAINKTKDVMHVRDITRLIGRTCQSVCEKIKADEIPLESFSTNLFEKQLNEEIKYQESKKNKN